MPEQLDRRDHRGQRETRRRPRSSRRNRTWRQAYAEPPTGPARERAASSLQNERQLTEALSIAGHTHACRFDAAIWWISRTVRRPVRHDPWHGVRPVERRRDQHDRRHLLPDAHSGVGRGVIRQGGVSSGRSPARSIARSAPSARSSTTSPRFSMRSTRCGSLGTSRSATFKAGFARSCVERFTRRCRVARLHAEVGRGSEHRVRVHLVSRLIRLPWTGRSARGIGPASSASTSRPSSR